MAKLYIEGVLFPEVQVRKSKAGKDMKFSGQIHREIRWDGQLQREVVSNTVKVYDETGKHVGDLGVQYANMFAPREPRVTVTEVTA